MTAMASYEPTSTEMNPMYATIQEHQPTSDSPLPSVTSTRDTATSETALLNPYEEPTKDVAARGGQPGGRLDTENTIYGKGPEVEKAKPVVHFQLDERSSKDRLWTCIRTFTCLVLPVLACVFAAAVLVVTLLIAFGVLQVAGEQAPAEQVGGAQHTGGRGSSLAESSCFHHSYWEGVVCDCVGAAATAHSTTWSQCGGWHWSIEHDATL